MIATIVIILKIVIPISILWIHIIVYCFIQLDKAVDNYEWERQREADRQEKDREQEEYLKWYKGRQEAKKKRKGR